VLQPVDRNSPNGTRIAFLRGGSASKSAEGLVSMIRHKNTAGFTLIELLIVVVIIGILAAIAIPKFANTKGKAYAASMRSDLRNLAVSQESYMYDHATYATSLGDMNVVPSNGVTVTIGVATGQGWNAQADHPMASPIRCYIFVGNAPNPPATTDGVVVCQ
jgi:prepilin-type N-terminal cleavage/methylation domain-containing protein